MGTRGEGLILEARAWDTAGVASPQSRRVAGNVIPAKAGMTICHGSRLRGNDEVPLRWLRSAHDLPSHVPRRKRPARVPGPGLLRIRGARAGAGAAGEVRSGARCEGRREGRG